MLGSYAKEATTMQLDWYDTVYLAVLMVGISFQLKSDLEHNIGAVIGLTFSIWLLYMGGLFN